MALVEWKDDFRIGIDGIDHEHRELIDLINGLHATLGERPSAREVADTLGEIHVRIAAHFALEEKVMRDNRYERYAEHKRDHERLLDGILDILDAFEDEPQICDGRLSVLLGEWFADHFRTHDARLHRHLPGNHAFD
jgi:hemerythrin-like metal-binding protein